MNSLNKKNLRLLCFLCLTLSALSCNSIKEIEYIGIKETKIESIGLQKGVVKTVMRYYNPNNFGLDIKETNLEVYANGNFLGTAENAERYAVPKKDTFDFPIFVHFNPIKMLSLVAMNTSLKKVKLNVKGTAKVGKKGVFIRVPIDVIEDVVIRE